MQKFRGKGRSFYFRFVDLEKALDRGLTEVKRWAMRKLGVESAVISMYTGVKTVVRTVYGNSNCFEVQH